jgi:large subunit ribosomal protein L29
MKAIEMRGKSASELKETMHELLREQFNLRMQRGSDQMSRPSEMKRVRREIARIKTVIREQRSGESS